MLRLNLGAGSAHLPGYENLDAKMGHNIDMLPWGDGTVDEIRASHVLEHFEHARVAAVVAHWVDKLRPGGILKIAVPDFEKIATQYLGGAEIDVQGYVMGGQADCLDFHKALFDEEALTDVLRAAGLVDIARWDSTFGDCASLPISLNLRGAKPLAGAAPPPLNRIGAVMSVPRVGFMDNFHCAQRAFGRLGVEVYRSNGVFYGQCLTRAIQMALADGCDAVFTVDYDSVFTEHDVRRILGLASDNPQAAAIAPMQSGRGRALPLFTMQDSRGQPMASIPFEMLLQPLCHIATGHFGLTFLRGSVMQKLPHPWFLAVPDDAQQWGPDRTDEDVYFWHNLAAHGHRAYLAPGVCIGHIEPHVVWPDGSMRARPQDIREYNAAGKPAWAFDPKGGSDVAAET